MEWIDAATAADRLGVKPATLYAYVSRGVLKRRHEGRRSLFDAAEIETLARRGRPRGQPPELVIESAVTALGLDRPYYRGHDALTLARTATFEAAAEWLWSAGPAAPPSGTSASRSGAIPASGGAPHPAGGASGSLPGPRKAGQPDEETRAARHADPEAGTRAARQADPEAGTRVAWQADPEAGRRVAWQADSEAVRAAVAAQHDLPESLLPLDRLQVITTVLGAADPFRFQLDGASVTATARRLISGLVDALPVLTPPDSSRSTQPPDHRTTQPGENAATHPRTAVGSPPVHAEGGGRSGGSPADRADEEGGSGGWARAELGEAGDAESPGGPEPGGSHATIAERLWPRLSPHPPAPGLLRALEAALVLLADHELAASTLAARVAASAKADPYAVVLTGLGVLGGPLHGGASYAAERLLTEVVRPSDAPRLIAERIRRGERIPGFGHSVYKNGDARATALLGLITEAAPDHDRLAAARAVVAEVRRRRLPEPNVDLALATLTTVAGMIPGAGEAVFAIARTAGWLAHAMEEYARGTLLRLRAAYTGPPVPGGRRQ